MLRESTALRLNAIVLRQLSLDPMKSLVEHLGNLRFSLSHPKKNAGRLDQTLHFMAPVQRTRPSRLVEKVLQQHLATVYATEIAKVMKHLVLGSSIRALASL